MKDHEQCSVLSFNLSLIFLKRFEVAIETMKIENEEEDEEEV
jgi:hypothetical protein